MKTVLLTGGSGFIGSHIAIDLVKRYKVIIIDNLSNSKKSVMSKIKKITKSHIVFYNQNLLNKKKT